MRERTGAPAVGRGAMQDWLLAAAEGRRAADVLRATDVRRSAVGLVDLASNDYLGLGRDPRLRAAAAGALAEHGAGARASRVVTGTTSAHVELEREVAALTGRPAALVFSSGYTANIGLLTALGDPDTLLVSDAHVHASMVDGARLSRSPVAICPHADLVELARLLRERRQPRAVVVVESIYSVLGDAADLTATAALCAEYDALLVVDEAHGVGVAGGGRGAVHAAGLAGAPHVVVTATLSKALGAQGGAVLGSELLREHLVNTARTFVFDTGLAPAAAAAAAEACRIVVAEPERVDAVHEAAARIAAAAGVERAPGAVQSILVGSPGAAAQAAARLLAEGIVVGCFRPPSVPDGVSRLRLTARAGLDLDRAVESAVRAAEYSAARTGVMSDSGAVVSDSRVGAEGSRGWGRWC
ncbi:aminotransferase class I/II-fold pyridoxal phosphate-dependent enzyme [Pseudonocardia xishanensis]